MNKSIMINLCTPLQSYGYKDYSNIRRTKLKPTKSAIAGLLACCGGIERNSPRIKEIEDSISIEVENYETPKMLGEEHKKEGYYSTLIDYQIAQNTDENPLWEANGKRTKKGNIILKKEYIQDAYFKVKITSSEENIDLFVKWLEDPEWVPYLGRKCCVPSIPIFVKEIT